MSIPGKEIYRCYDEWGPIRVLEEGRHRYLAFGEDAEQSCMLRDDPALPIHQYTQAMLLSLLFRPEPRHVTVLGLGAGSLVNSLLAFDAALRVTAVELREQVAEVARQWFGFRDSGRLALHIGDAGEFMAGDPAPCDILMADIYSDQGMVETQLSPAFLCDCYQTLADQGVLVLNLWDEGGGGGHPRAVERLSMLFESCMLCPIEEGNLVLFAFKRGTPALNPRRSVAQAKQLSRRLRFPLHRLLDRLRWG